MKKKSRNKTQMTQHRSQSEIVPLNFRFSKMAEEIHHPKEHDEEDELNLEDVEELQVNTIKDLNRRISSKNSHNGCRILDRQV